MRNKYDSLELKEIFDLTIKLSGINPSTVKRSKSADRYWSFVEKVWKNSATKIGCNVMEVVMFHIHWGCYPKSMSQNPDLLKLVDMVEKEFLKHTCEMEAAKSKQVFRSAYTATLKSKSPYTKQKHGWASESYKDFLHNKTLYKLYGGQIVVDKLNLVTTSRYALEDMKDKAMICYKYKQFKSKIQKLIPVACMWTDQEWSNEQNILSNLQSLYGVDYAREWEDFDFLMNMLAELEKKEPSMYYVLTVKNFSYKTARAIWPTNTNQKLEELFMHFSKKCKQYISRAKSYSACSYADALDMRTMLIDSWLFKEIYSWYENKLYELPNEVRKMLFDIALNV